MQHDPYGDAESLFRAFYQGVVRVAYSLAGNTADAEDIAQESFCKVLAVWTRIAVMPTAGEQRAYLTRIVINEALRVLRHRKREFLDADAGEREVVDDPVYGQVQARGDLHVIWTVISDLPEMRRAVISLYAAGYEYGEIAAWLDISISAVRSHMSYARRKLSTTVARERKVARG